jgi:hypothetical protein
MSFILNSRTDFVLVEAVGEELPKKTNNPPKIISNEIDKIFNIVSPKATPASCRH